MMRTLFRVLGAVVLVLACGCRSEHRSDREPCVNDPLSVLDCAFVEPTEAIPPAGDGSTFQEGSPGGTRRMLQ